MKKIFTIAFVLHNFFIQNVIAGNNFGSIEVLNSLWSIRELQSCLNEKKIKKLAISNNSPPNKYYINLIDKVSSSQKFQYSIRSVRPYGKQKILALTFDLCELANEIAGYDGSTIDYLREQNVKATFFACGKWMRSHQERTMQLIADPLFEVGNHSWSHENLALINGQSLIDQIIWPQIQYKILYDKLINKAIDMKINSREIDKIPSKPLVFRFPYGRCSPNAFAVLKDYGLTAIQWDIVSGDPDINLTAVDISKSILNRVKSGSIIIFHANGRGYETSKTIRKIVPALRSLDYRFVTASELINMGHVISTKNCYELKPGDNIKYDKMFE